MTGPACVPVVPAPISSGGMPDMPPADDGVDCNEEEAGSAWNKSVRIIVYMIHRCGCKVLIYLPTYSV